MAREAPCNRAQWLPSQLRHPTRLEQCEDGQECHVPEGPDAVCRAWYGLPGTEWAADGLDVTESVRRLLQRGDFVSPELLEDPVPGVKLLSIEVRCFDTVFAEDPSRLRQLEWLAAEEPLALSFTSHSWLRATLHGGMAVDMELASDVGFNEFIRTAPAKIHNGHRCSDFVMPLTLGRLRQIAVGIAEKRPYDLFLHNCHHFAFALWNCVVVEEQRAVTYPDQLKAQLGKLLLGPVLSLLSSSASHHNSAERLLRSSVFKREFHHAVPHKIVEEFFADLRDFARVLLQHRGAAQPEEILSQELRSFQLEVDGPDVCSVALCSFASERQLHCFGGSFLEAMNTVLTLDLQGAMTIAARLLRSLHGHAAAGDGIVTRRAWLTPETLSLLVEGLAFRYPGLLRGGRSPTTPGAIPVVMLVHIENCRQALATPDGEVLFRPYTAFVVRREAIRIQTPSEENPARLELDAVPDSRAVSEALPLVLHL